MGEFMADICTPDSEMQVPHDTETIKWLYYYKTELYSRKMEKNILS